MAPWIPKLLTVRDAARVTGIQVWRWYEILARGDGPRHFRLGRVIRISEAELIAWIDRVQEQSARAVAQ